MLSDLHMSYLILFHFTCFWSFLQWNRKMLIVKIIEISIKIDVRFECVLWKNVWFCFISIVWVHFSHKTAKFWNLKSLKYFSIFDHKKNDVRFQNLPWKNVWFCLILFGFTLFIKLQNFENHWNTLFSD